MSHAQGLMIVLAAAPLKAGQRPSRQAQALLHIKARDSSLSRFRKRSRLFNMISPSQRRAQLKCSEGIPVLGMRLPNENCHHNSYADCGRRRPRRTPF